MRAEAKDQWKRHYTVARGGTLEIRNTNGVIKIEPGEGDAIDITADRTVQAGTDQAAKDALAAFEIKETVEPDRVTIDGTNRGGLSLSGMSRRVEYHVRAPEWISVKLSTTNGDISVGPKLPANSRQKRRTGASPASASKTA